MLALPQFILTWWVSRGSWNPIRIFRHRRVVGLVFFLGLLLNATIWGLFFWAIPFGSSSVVLHYNIFSGIDRVGTWWGFALLPGTGTFLLLLHAFAIMAWFEYDRLVRWLLLGSAVLFQALLLLYEVFLILQNR